MPDLTRHGHRNPLHNYKSRCIYLITITQPPGAPRLADITSGAVPQSLWTPSGHDFMAAVRQTFEQVPEITVLEFVLMPDHAHLVIFATAQLPQHIGYYIRKLKALATRRIRVTVNNPDATVFTPDFHDRILRGKDQLRNMINYVIDNPRRLALRRQNPDYFTVRHSINIAGHEYNACGNIFLLNYFERVLIRIHRHWPAETLIAAKHEWQTAAANGATLVSPFIHPTEKEVLREAIGLGARVILLTNEPIEERYKPGGKYFNLCAAGRLLVLQPLEIPSGEITRSIAMSLNARAEGIANGL